MRMECMQSLYCVLNGNTAVREAESVIADLVNNRSTAEVRPPSLQVYRLNKVDSSWRTKIQYGEQS